MGKNLSFPKTEEQVFAAEKNQEKLNVSKEIKAGKAET
jgi:hypothetical protein